MPYTDEQVAAIEAQAKAAKQELTELKASLPGWIKREASEIAESKLKDFKPAVAEKPTEKPAEEKPANDPYRRELDAMKKEQEDERKENVLLKSPEIGKFFDPQDAVQALKSKLVKNDEGQWGVKGTKTLELTGEKVETFITVDEAIKDFAKAKPHYVKATNLKGGTGASGDNKAAVDFETLPKTYSEVMQKPALVGKLLSTPEGKAHYERLKRENK